ncbi:type II secretion system F family protein [Patescibacteria group bacterium]|nr:type II secretion system F family protein [Patescibacteria group bacterium]
MPIYKYIVKNKQGENIKGKVEAISQAQAVSTLLGRDLFVIDVSPLGQRSGFLANLTKSKIKFEELVNFTRQLATMINAGLPLATSLSILEEQGKSEMSKLTGNLLKDVEGGLSFSTALAKYKENFSRIYVQLVRAGEVGGVLDDVLNRLAITMEKEKDFKAKTKGAMVYPIIILFAMAAVVVVMMVAVIPKLTLMYQDFDAELPVATKILMSVSDFFVSSWWVLLILIVGAIFSLRSYKKTPHGEKAIDALYLRIPILGVLKQKVVLTDFTRTLSLLLGAGVSLMEALDIVASAIDSAVYRGELKEINKQVEKGVTLSDAVARYDNFPAILHQMISVGEETGKLDEILGKISEYFEKESEYAIKNLTTAIEPIIMILLGLGVGFIVIAIIMPIYSLTSQF